MISLIQAIPTVATVRTSNDRPTDACAFSSSAAEPANSAEWVTRAKVRYSTYVKRSTTESETLSRPRPSAVMPRAASKAAGRINAIAASVSIVASERAPTGMAQSSGQHGGAEHQQHVPNNGTSYRRFHHIVKPGPQGDERDDQFGGVAESRIEKPANSLAHTLCELFG